MPESSFYPTLDTLLPEEKLPAFLQQGTGFLSKVFYKDLIIENGQYGDRSTYRVKLFSYRPLGVDLSADGLRLVINPGDDAGTFEQAITLAWRLEILRFVQGRKVEDLADPKELLQILKEVFQINERRMLCQLVYTVQSTGLIADFIDAYHEVTGSLAPIASDLEFETIPDLVDHILENADQIYDAAGDINNVVDLVLGILEEGLADDVADTAQALLDNIKELAKEWLKELDLEGVARMFIPYAALSLDDISVALEFPRSLFQPVDETTNEVIEDEKKVSRLQFDVGSLKFDTEDGFEFENEGELHFTKSMIMDTGMCFGFTGGKLDLKEGENIDEADTDGRDPSFKGFFVDEAVITLPDFFAGKDGITNPEIVIDNLLVGHPGGISGQISLKPEGGQEAKLQYVFFNEVELELDQFSLTLQQNAFENVTVSGLLRSEHLFRDTNGQSIDVDIDLEFSEEGFAIEASTDTATGMTLVEIEKAIEVTLDRLRVGRQSKVWEFGFAGFLHNRSEVPAVEKFLPKYIQVIDFLIKSDKELDYHLKIEWESGLYIDFSKEEGLRLYIPVNQSVGGAFYLEGIQMESDPGAWQEKLEIDTTLIGAKLKLGPVLGVVDGLGLRTGLSLPDGGGNLGPMQLDMALIPPKGLGISVGGEDSKVGGGGYLYLDAENGRYYGGLELKFGEEVRFSAIGILTTQMPDGEKGFSFLILITGQFPPIQLSFGFTLNGLGGLLGAHRSMDVDYIRSGLKAGALESILFPQDVVNNINQIITDLESAFPLARNQFTLGLMAKIGWGTPTIISLELGLLICVPDPVRLAIVGILRSQIPDEELALIELNVAFLGTIDFERGMLAFDASIYNSRLLTFTLEGDMAVRLSWGQTKEFVLSIGGFHPSYSPAASLAIPSMNRLTVNLLPDNPRLTVKAYFAITSNTVQFGGLIDFFFEIKVVKTFQIVGFMGMDAIFHFSPFSFRVDIAAMLGVMNNNQEILAISLEFTLQGPTPWQVQGTAKFKALGIEVPVSLDVSFGQEQNATLPNEPVLPLLTAALEDDANWQSRLSGTQYQCVTLKELELPAGEIATLPSGAISVSQRVVPLDREISKFGHFEPADGNEFSIQTLKVEGEAQSLAAVQDFFAPANFTDMSDADKLKSPSFQAMNSGVKQADASLDGGGVAHRAAAYDWTLIDESVAPQANPLPVSSRIVSRFSQGGRLGQSAGARRMRKESLRQQSKVRVTQPEMAAV